MSIWDWSPEELNGSWESLYPKRSLSDYWVDYRFSVEKQRIISKVLSTLAEKKTAIAQARQQWNIKQADLANYPVYKPVVDIDLRKVSRQIAEAELQQRIQQQEQRLAALSNLLAPWGIELDGDPITLDVLNVWFCKYLHLFTRAEFMAYVEETGTPEAYYLKAAPVWYSIILDISLYMLHELTKEVDGLEWGISQADKQSSFYNRPVLILTRRPTVQIDPEPEIWALVPLLKGNNLTNKMLMYFKQDYQRHLKRCRY